jgi:hypothetical protein
VRIHLALKQDRTLHVLGVPVVFTTLPINVHGMTVRSSALSTWRTVLCLLAGPLLGTAALAVGAVLFLPLCSPILRGRTASARRQMQDTRRTTIPLPADVVWAFVHPAESSLVIWPQRFIRAYTDPTSPRGAIGERQCFADPTGRTTTEQVIALEPGRLATTVLLGMPSGVEVLATTIVEPVGSTACVLTLSLLARTSGQSGVIPEGLNGWGAWAESHLERVRAHLVSQAPVER